MRDKTIAVLWKKDGEFIVPSSVLFVRASGRKRFYRNVSLSSIMRIDDLRQSNDRRIRWEYPGEVDRQLGVNA